MKKILAEFAALVILSCLALSMVSCGSVDMNELKTTLEGLEKKGEINVEFNENSDSKTLIKSYVVTNKAENSKDKEYLYIREYASTKLAKIQCEMAELEEDMEKEYLELKKELNEEYLALGASVSELDEPYEIVIIRKGEVLIYGSKTLYEKVFG